MKRMLYIMMMLSVSMRAMGHEEARTVDQAAGGQSSREMRAVRVNPHPPRIDGVLDDLIWQHAPVSSGFIQRDPEDGEPASEKTEVRVVYDDEAVYFGVMCFDGEPDKIVAPLVRRDFWASGDRVSLNLDPRHDHKTGFFFVLGPSGWKADGILFNDGRRDDTWNGVWEGNATIHDQGWSAEFRIPYHVLRFSARENYVWGVQVSRDILRKQEEARWAYWPKDASGWASRFGHLTGIENIHPKRTLEVLPFGVSKGSVVPKGDEHPTGRDFTNAAGVDLRYGLTPGVSLNATLNPDFGQVEADPAEVNLGVFETFFDERRPFFLEGNSIYRYSGPGIVDIQGPARLFHSRRIGRRPNRFDKPDGTGYISRPDGTTILTAANLSGKTATGTSFGVINALTDEEFATIEDEDTGERSSHLLEPTTNYLVGRVQQDVFKNSKLGAFASLVSGSGFDPAYVGSADGELRLRNNTVKLFTRWTGSVRHDEDNVQEKGYEGAFLLEKTGGTFGGEVYLDTRSREFDVNDLGFMDRNDRIQLGGWINAQIRNPYWFARDSGFNFNLWQHWNQDRTMIDRGFNFHNWHTLHNYWWVGGGIHHEFEARDDLATRGGPIMLDPSGWQVFFNAGSDGRKSLQIQTWDNWRWGDFGETFRQSYGGRIRYRPVGRFTIEIEPIYSKDRRDAQWIENVDDDDDGNDDHYVFGKLFRNDWDLTTRVTYSFTPDMNVQFWMQQLVVTGDYREIKELARPDSYDFLPYAGLDENPDFDERSLRSNFVFRWEYRPGSTLFVVWQQSRSEDFETDDPTFRPIRGMFDAFGDEGDNIFLIKLSYWLGV